MISMSRVSSARRGERGGAQLWLIFGVTVALGAVSFALQNGVPVTVNFLFFRFDSSLAMVLLMAFGLGVVAAGMLSWPILLRERWALGRERKRVAALEADLQRARQGAEKVVGGRAAIEATPVIEKPPAQPPAVQP